MKREQLEHLIRAAGSIVDVDEMLIIGSQAILGTHSEDELPPDVTMSIEADLAFFDDPLESKSDLVDGSIGEESPFQHQFGYYAQGVSVGTAVLPMGWKDRLVTLAGPGTRGVRGMCLEIHDLWVSKMAAARSKDIAFCEELIRAGLVNAATLVERLDSTALGPTKVALAKAVIARSGVDIDASANDGRP